MLLLSGCEGFLTMEGKVQVHGSATPLDSVKIYVPSLQLTQYTDSLGRFEIFRGYSCMFSCPEIEILLYKPGYRLSYYNHTQQHNSLHEGFLFTMKPGSNALDPSIKPIPLYVLESINLLLSLLNLFTFLFLLRSKVKFRFVLLLCLLLFNFEMRWNYFVSDFRLEYLQALVPLRHVYFSNPLGWFPLYIPLFSLVFWCVYTWRRQWVVRESGDRYSNPPPP